MINVYDFDKTIYNGDSSLDFYFFCLKKKKYIIFLLPLQIISFLKYYLKIITKEKFKESFFIFLEKFENIDLIVDEFWINKKSKIEKWYLEQKQDTDIIISASPQFLLEKMCNILNVRLIATLVDKKTGKFYSKNCYGEEKVNRFKKYTIEIIDEFYSDSLSDMPMIKLSKKGYLIKGKKKLLIK